MNDRKLETQVKNKKHAFAKQDEISNGHTPHKRVIYRERWCVVCVTLSGVTRLEHREGKVNLLVCVISTHPLKCMNLC
jgi:hypothetical protein